MKMIYNRIAEEFLSVEEAQDIIYEIDKATKDVDFSNYSSMDLEDCCDRLNHEDIYGCGTNYYIVEDDISKSELLKIIYG